jgi:hypothetical protein
VRDSIAARDCRTAVKRLNGGLADAYPEMFLLAGSLYENGVCVKRDWARAVTFYGQANEAGEHDGAARLAAGYADPANGPDVAAALWWAGKRPGFRLKRCAVSEDAGADPDRFVAELSTWPKERLAYCNYVSGVLLTMSSEVKYPELALGLAVGGDVTLRFFPGVPRIELQRGASREYELLGRGRAHQLRERETQGARDSFVEALSGLADRALARYPHRDGALRLARRRPASEKSRIVPS